MINFASSHQPHSTIVADALFLPHPCSRFDFAISIAVIHHLSTPVRRTEAIRAVLETLKPGSGRALFFVWALEQKNSRRGWSVGDEQDQMVPWVLRCSGEKKSGENESTAENGVRTFHRYYHLFREGELEECIEKAGGTVVKNGYDRDNWWAIASKVT